MKALFRTTIVLVVLMFCVVSSYSQTEDVLGWQDARWGMSEDELLAKFKSQVTKLPKKENFSNSYVDYVISDYEIESFKYTVYFHMDKDSSKLCQIVIRDNVTKSLVSRDRLFPFLESLLTRKYGVPGYKKEEKKPSDVSLERQWIFPTTTISLSYLWMSIGELNSLTIRYFPSKSGEVNKV